ncbi:hypothetical protein AX774_g3773 [Zancudomyces culisetae]|uniref:DNA-directed RNA polymerase n=1 Tax=Zancudomyces culisetae TaxID=1213189 RepID=A0A1R1PP74_ZANCU|nr:hypothetical protein AX774_g3773 [Zancudomyces culisetae]|eukprot:OMH82741.1 hypothetical protein AX774_g3773 [Zancudomyces culisetae]
MRRFPNGQIKFVGEVTDKDIDSLSVYDLLSEAGNLIPYVNHNQAARVSFSIHMQKQAVSSDYDIFGGKLTKAVNKWYNPLCEEPMVKAPSTDKFPYNGINLKCKIAFYNKMNIEDAIVISKSAALKMTSYRISMMIITTTTV